MKVLHVNAGNEYGGGLHHIVSLVSHMKKSIDASLLVFEEGPVAQAAREKNIPVFVLGQKSKFDIRFLSALEKFIQKNQIDIIHTHGPRANAYINRIIKKIRPVKWVITVHSDPELDFKDRNLIGSIFEKIHIRSFKKADFVISVSREIETIVQKYGVDPKFSQVIHNGIQFREMSHKNNKNKIFTLLSVGRLEKVKGYDVLIEALSKVYFSDWRLILCGDGSQKKRLKSLSAEKNIEKNICFTDWIEKKDLDNYYRKADVFVLPSLSESFSLVALEAMEFRLPLIASNVGDVELMFPKNAKNFLVEKNDAKQLKNSIEEAYELWLNKDLASLSEKFYLNGKQFSIKKQVEKTIAIYHQL